MCEQYPIPSTIEHVILLWACGLCAKSSVTCNMRKMVGVGGGLCYGANQQEETDTQADPKRDEDCFLDVEGREASDSCLNSSPHQSS